jgi:predicted O-methyltransferase YrrM
MNLKSILPMIDDIDHLADQSIFDIYDRAVSTFPDGSIFVELGCYTGGSTIYLAERIKQANKGICIYAVDIWRNMIAPGIEGSIFDIFWANVERHGCQQFIRPIQFDSRQAAFMFDEEQVDFVFIDADHRYEYVEADIRNWLPVVKRGGWIGGHDYNQQVKLAVHHVLEETHKYKVERFEGGCESFLVKL